MVVRLFLVALIAFRGPALWAQDGGSPMRLDIVDTTGGSASLTVFVGEILQDPSLEEALETGLPLRLEVVTQLWRDGFFDSQVGETRWRATAARDPLEGDYVLDEGSADGGEIGGAAGPTESVRRFDGLAEMRSALPFTTLPVPAPREEGRYYYLARLSVETLSLSDLDELRRWLGGDLAPAISGDGDVESAVERGLRRTIVRLLGMPTRRFDLRSPTFEHAPGGG